jgi:uncharacterized membrane protein
MIEQNRAGRSYRYGFVLLITAFVVLFFTLLVCKHNAFNTRTYDFARFDQAIWNTLQGRFLFSTIRNASILSNHFSPFLAALSPLFLLWNDPRVLLLVQVVCVAATGFFLFLIVRDKHPLLALWFLAAFYLNPVVHEITLFEFRRVVPAMPFLALALYALYSRKRALMLAGLVLALLCKENVAFVVAMVGFYLLVFERDWKWGLLFLLLGATWLVVVSVWVIPAFAPPEQEADLYPQLHYFRTYGDSYGEVLKNLAQAPFSLLGRLVEEEQVRGLVRLFVPLGLVLPFLAPGWAAICLPTLGYMLLSDRPTMYSLSQWYPATVIPVLFCAVGVGLGKLPLRRARWATALLMVGTLAGFLLYSPAPLGGAYEANLYEVTEHHRLAAESIRSIPEGTSVATQPHYVPHLSHREHIYHYPWIVIGVENTDYILLDRHSNPYPFTPTELDEQIDNLMSDTSYTIETEADGIYLFRKQDWSFSNRYVVEDTMGLACGQVAVQDERGVFWPVVERPVELKPGQRVRVSLHWEALADVAQERTISVRIADASGRLVAQHDGWPGQGTKPTNWWKKGWTLRDVYYLDVAPDAQPGPGSLNVVVYDSYDGELVPIDGEVQMLRLCEVTITP